MIDKLIKFAKAHHKTLAGFTNEQVKVFFDVHKKTTLVRIDNVGDITGVAVWLERDGIIRFITIAGVGDFWDNYKTMRSYIKKIKKPVIISKRCV